MTQTEFDANWSAVAEKLEEIIGLRAKTSIHPLCRRLRRAAYNYSKGDKSLANAQLANAQHLLHEFTLIHVYDERLFKSFKRNFTKIRNHENYFGFRMELEMASSLISKKVRFQKSEAPDFVVEFRSEFGIECNSCHLQIGKTHESGDLSYKILSSLKTKSSNSYHISPLILAIDISNLLYHDSKEESSNVLSDADNLRDKLQEAVTESKFDALLTFFYYWTSANSLGSVKFSAAYNRYDAEKSSLSVISFLDKYYPYGDHREEGRVHEVV